MKNTLFYPVVLVLFCLLANGRLAAQEGLVISPGVSIGDTTQWHELQTARGDRLLGHVLSVGDLIVFRFYGTGDILSFPRAEVRRISVPGAPKDATEEWTERAPYDADLFYTYAGRPTEGRSRYRNTLLFLNQIDVHITPYLRIGGGYLLPFFLTNQIRLSAPLRPRLQLGFTANTMFAFTEETSGVATHVYPTLTLGGEQRYLNLGMGYAFTWGFGSETIPLLQVGGGLRLSSRWRLMTDMVIAMEEQETIWLPTLVFTHRGRRSRWDLGFISAAAADLPLFPIAAFSTYF